MNPITFGFFAAWGLIITVYTSLVWLAAWVYFT